MSFERDSAPFDDWGKVLTVDKDGSTLTVLLGRPYMEDEEISGERITGLVNSVPDLNEGDVLRLGSELFGVISVDPTSDETAAALVLQSLGHRVDIISLAGALRTTWIDEAYPYYPYQEEAPPVHDTATVTLRGPGRSAFAVLSAGRNHSLGLDTDGKITAWGDDSFGQSTVPAPNSGFVAVSAGESHSLAVRSDGSVAAWGSNTYAQCTLPSPNSGFAAVAAGGAHSLGLKSDGTIVAWGANGSGQCNVPAPNSGFVAIAAGGSHSLGLRSDGTVVAWGLSLQGQCTVPAPNAGFSAIAGGWRHSLGLKSDGTIVAWGYNDQGQCTVPSPNADFAAIAAGWRHGLGVQTDGTVVAWGYNDQGQGIAPDPATGFAAVAAGEGHGLGLKTDGTCVAWGLDSSGQATVPPTVAGHLFFFLGPIAASVVPAAATIDSAEIWINSDAGGAVEWSVHQVLPVTALAALDWLQSATGRPWSVPGCGASGVDYAAAALDSDDEIPAGASALASGAALGAILNTTRSVTKVLVVRATGGTEAAIYSELPDNDTLRPYLRLRYSMPRG